MSERVWHYYFDYIREGPVLESVLREKLQYGEVSLRALVWTDGLDDWRPVHEEPIFRTITPCRRPQPAAPPVSPKPALKAPAATASPRVSPQQPQPVPAPFKAKAPAPRLRPTPVAASVAPSPKVPSVGTPPAPTPRGWVAAVRRAVIRPPWVRLVARMVDFAIGGAIALLPISMMFGTARIPLLPRVWCFLAFSMLWEVLCLTIFGNTPGKAFYRLRLEPSGGDRLTFVLAWKRSWKVFYRGLGFGVWFVIPISLPITLGRYFESGRMTWDDDARITVRERPVGSGRLITGAMLSVSTTVLLCS